MRCEDVARMLPETVEGTPVELAMQTHVESCLRCQAELARYRRMLRALQQLRTRFLEPSPSLLAQTLAALEEAGERAGHGRHRRRVAARPLPPPHRCRVTAPG
jgi:hypothetical protein